MIEVTCPFHAEMQLQDWYRDNDSALGPVVIEHYACPALGCDEEKTITHKKERSEP